MTTPQVAAILALEKWFNKLYDDENIDGHPDLFELALAAIALAKQQQAEMEALRKDAERYRWLRSRTDAVGTGPFIATRNAYMVGCVTHEFADEQVDAAITQQTHGESRE